MRDYGLLHEAELLPRSYGGNSWFGKFHPAAGQRAARLAAHRGQGVLRGKIGVKMALFGHKIPSSDLKAVKRIYEKVEAGPSATS